MPETADLILDAVRTTLDFGNKGAKDIVTRITNDVQRALGKVSGRELTPVEKEVKDIIERERDLFGIL